MITLKIGDKAPGFELPNGNGKKVRLSNFKNKKIILYFYPKDDTPGCTKEACDFRDGFDDFKNMSIEVIGISNDNQQSHEKFAEKYNLQFTLLSDADKVVSKKYGVYELKTFMGKRYYGIVRSTFIIDKGKIKNIFYKVNPESHIAEIKEVLKF